jgi:MFS transporter, ACS family, hexuronate transporter
MHAVTSSVVQAPTGAVSSRAVVLLIGFLLASTTINWIDRQVLSVLAPVLRDEFRLTNADYAAILNAFMITYAVAMPAAGWALDRLGTARGLSIAVGWWSFAGMLTGMSAGPLTLAGCRSLLAVGEAASWPSFARAVALWVPVRLRTLAMGVCNSGSSLGATIAPILVVFVTQRYGWRAAFWVTGSIGFLWILAFRFFLSRYPAIEASEKTSITTSRDRVSWLRLLRFRQTWAIVICRFLADPLWYFYVFWIPEFLTRQKGLDLQQIGAVAWIPFLVSDASNLVAGWLALRMHRAGLSVNRARKILLATGALVSPLGIAAAFSTSVLWTMVFISIAIFFWMLWSITVHTLPSDFFPAGVVASVSGLSGTGSTVGSVVSIWTVGQILDATGSFSLVFILLGSLMPLALLLGTTLMGEIRPLTTMEETCQQA